MSTGTVEIVELERWLELEVPCEMRPAVVYGEDCPRPAVWRIVRWCGCSELSCEECRSGYLAWLSDQLRAAPHQLVVCAKCRGATRASAPVDVVLHVDAL